MRIVERTPDLLKLEEPPPPLLRRSFISAAVFLSLPSLAGIFMFRSLVGVLFALGSVASACAIVGAAYLFARHTFRSRTTATFDLRTGVLTIAPEGREPETVALGSITDVEVESTWTGRSASYRTALQLGPTARVPLSERYCPDAAAFQSSERAIREVLALPMPAARPPISERREVPAFAPRVTRTEACRFCLNVSSDLHPLELHGVKPDGVVETVTVERCADCARSHAWHEKWGPILGMLAGAGAAGAAFFAFVYVESRGPVRNVLLALPFMLLALFLGMGGAFAGRGLCDPSRRGKRPQSDWKDLPEITARTEKGWTLTEARGTGID